MGFNSVNKHMRVLLKESFGVKDDDVSSFAGDLTDNIASMHDRFVSYMYIPKGTAEAVLVPPSEDQQHYEHSDPDDPICNDAAVLVDLQEFMMADIVEASSEMSSNV
jgi:hypothetical protein